DRQLGAEVEHPTPQPHPTLAHLRAADDQAVLPLLHRAQHMDRTVGGAAMASTRRTRRSRATAAWALALLVALAAGGADGAPAARGRSSDAGGGADRERRSGLASKRGARAARRVDLPWAGVPVWHAVPGGVRGSGRSGRRSGRGAAPVRPAGRRR